MESWAELIVKLEQDVVFVYEQLCDGRLLVL